LTEEGFIQEEETFMKIAKWLITGCLVFTNLFVQAQIPEDPLEFEKQFKKQIEKILVEIQQNNAKVVQYYQQGLFEQALPLAEQTFEMVTGIFGDQAPATIESRNNLASIYQGLGRLDEALPLVKENYSLMRDILGDKDPSTLASLHNLAETYQELGQLEKALPLFEKCYRLKQKELSEKHPYTLLTLESLVRTHQKLGQLEKALSLAKIGYRFSLEVLGEKDFLTLSYLDNLINIHQQLNHLKIASSLSKRYESLRNKILLGERYPDGVEESLALAQEYSCQAVQDVQNGLFEPALSLAEESSKIRTEILGEQHPATLESRNNVAAAYKELGRLNDALRLLEENYRLIKKKLPEKHPFALVTLNNLAQIYQELGFFKKALPLSEKCYRLRKEVLGEKDPETLITLNNLVGLYRSLGDSDKALKLAETSYHLCQAVLGETHLDTIISTSNLAGIYLDLGKLKKALPLSKKSFRLSTEMLGERHPTTLTNFANLAGTYIQLGRLKDALPLSEKGYRLSIEVLGEKHPDTLKHFNNLARTYTKLGRLKEALPIAEKGYRLSQEILGDKHPDTFSSLTGLALVYSELGHLKKALTLSEEGYRLSMEKFGEEHPMTFASINNLAKTYQDLGHLKDALSLFKKSYSLAQKLFGNEHPTTLTSLDNLSSIYHDLGHVNKAFDVVEKSYLLKREILGETHPDSILGLNNLAKAHRVLGHLDKALYLFENCYQLSKEKLGIKHPYTATIFNNLTGIYYDLGRSNDVLPLQEENYRLLKETLGERHPKTIGSLMNLGEGYVQNYHDLARLNKKALPKLEKGFELFKEVLGKKHPFTLSSFCSLAVIYHHHLNQLDEALSLYEECFRLRGEVLGTKHPDTLQAMNNLAGIYVTLDHLDKALPLYEEAHRLLDDLLGDTHPDTLTSLSNLAKTYVLQGHIHKGMDYLKTLVEGIEKQRKNDFSTENRQIIFKKWMENYFLLAKIFIYLHPENVFSLVEMSKARTLLESLATQLAAHKTGLSATEQQQLQDNKAQLAFLNNRIAKALENHSLKEKIELETEKNQLVSQFNQFHRELMAKYPKYAQLSEVNIIDAIEGAKYLPEDAVLISYFVHENEVLVFTLQADGRHTGHDLGKIPQLEENLITDYRDQLFAPIKEPGSKPIGSSELISFGAKPKKKPSLSLQLGQKLLGPLYEDIKDKPHWIISPSGPLALIPFETLRLDGDEQPQVIAKHQISYVQSLSMLALLQERGKVYNNLPCRGELLAMGAPIYKDTRAGITKGHPSTIDFKMASLMVKHGNDYTRAFKQLGREDWKALPGALAELEQLEKLFKDTKPRIYKQAEATEQKLQCLNKQGVLAQYRYLVFSAHGYLSPQVSALSAIVLGQVNNPPEIDGYVTAAEWPGYDLKSDLMVLSACETGLGEVMRGEGIMGLPYALYVAGNKNTILSLWKLSDDITAEFITSFFKKLKKGSGQIEALTATKREFLNKGGRYSNPKYWAAFVLYGV
jgi:CHAT domain-containing protein